MTENETMETDIEKQTNDNIEYSEEITSEYDKDELWDEIGFHKGLAGFWYKLIFSLFSIVFGIAVIGLYYKYLYPFPESAGYRSAATGVFGLFFTVFDLGTWACMDRFIADAQIKDPNKMVKYIQYFIWYQMITGLIQTTVVSVYALFIVPRQNLAYAVWIMLIHSTTQYPGFLGVFRGVLNSLQDFKRSEVLGFISGEVFQKITEIAFVLWGRQWGMNNPQIGEIMGIAIGATIGFYIDDFFATMLSAWYFTRVMKDKNIQARDCFRIDFDWEMVKEVAVFGLKSGMPSVFGVAVSLYELWLWIAFVPQYTTFITLSGMASGIANIINQAQGMPITMLLSEAYMNDKKKLTQYYIAQAWRFYGLVQFFFIAIILIVYTVLEPAYVVLGLDKNYIQSLPFLIPWLIRHMQQPYTSLGDSILTGCNHPTRLMFLRFFEELMKVVFQTLWIHPAFLGFPDKFGFNAIIWIIPCGIYPAIMWKTILMYTYTNKNIVKLKFPLWQCFGAPALAALGAYGLGWVGKKVFFDPLHANDKTMIGLVLMFIWAVSLIIFFYFPMTALLGGWDKNNLHDFEKAMVMSGPSKPLVWLMYKSVEVPARHAKLHNKFGIDASEAEEEAWELLQLKHINALKK